MGDAPDWKSHEQQASAERLRDAVRAFLDKNLTPDPGKRAVEATLEEKDWFDRMSQQAQIEQMKTVNLRWRHDMKLRAKYASLAFGLASWAVWFWICMFVAVGIGNAASGRPILSDTALITLTTGATVNVVAVFVVVIRGLFPGGDASNDRRLPESHRNGS